jgi:hypothetical protein
MALLGTMYQFLLFHFRASTSSPALNKPIWLVELRGRDRLRQLGVEMSDDQWKVFSQYKWDEFGWAILIATAFLGIGGLWYQSFNDPARAWIVTGITLIQIATSLLLTGYWRKHFWRRG